ncbi:MAG: hypothetical protein K2W92_09455 [Alphaproteobacteria bacterium]|nr:hypothetical protein [Alphaproteobacteria bacterium]
MFQKMGVCSYLLAGAAEDFNQSNRANLVVINGKRRIGKSRLAEEFAKKKVFLSFPV